MSTVTLLISCMHQHDHSILEKSNVQSDCVVVNQCDRDETEEFDFVNKFGQKRHCKFISTSERGLSRSRNMAIANAPDDAICLICDDDEYFDDDMEQKIACAYERIPDASLIVFSLIRNDLERPKIYPAESCRLRFSQILRTSSLQITFKKSELLRLGIAFDVKMGSGTGNGGGEENKFLLDMKRNGANLFYSPECIATVNPGESQWFKGYTPKHMQNLGWSSRRSMGALLGFIYINRWVLTHTDFYKNDITPFSAYINAIKGFFSNR